MTTVAVTSAQPSFDFGDFPELHAERVDLCEYDEKYAADIFVHRGDPEVQLYDSAPWRSGRPRRT